MPTQIKAKRQLFVGGQVINPGETATVDDAQAWTAVNVLKEAEYAGEPSKFDPEAPAPNEPTETERRMEAGLPAAERAELADERTRKAQDSQLEDDMARFSGATAADAAAAQQETKQRQASVQAPTEPAPAPAPAPAAQPAPEPKPAEPKPAAPTK